MADTVAATVASPDEVQRYALVTSGDTAGDGPTAAAAVGGGVTTTTAATSTSSSSTASHGASSPSYSCTRSTGRRRRRNPLQDADTGPARRRSRRLAGRQPGTRDVDCGDDTMMLWFDDDGGGGGGEGGGGGGTRPWRIQ